MIVFVNIPDAVIYKTVLVSIVQVMRKFLCLLIKNIYASSISANPKMALSIIKNGIDSIAIKTLFILFKVIVMFKRICFWIIQVKPTAMGTYPYILVFVFVNGPGIIAT